MHSGGNQKLDWGHIFIEAPEAEAKSVFFSRFGRNPNRVTCTCCGEDYSISEDDTLEASTAFERNCEYAWFRPDGTECPKDEGWKPGKGTTPGYSERYVERKRKELAWGEYVTLPEYIKSGHVKIIPASEISDDERKTEVPTQGYVWV